MNSRTTRRFWEANAVLPLRVKQQARDTYQIFRSNSRHPGLHFKMVISDPPTYSVRVGIGYRALGVLEGEEMEGVDLSCNPALASHRLPD